MRRRKERGEGEERKDTECFWALYFVPQSLYFGDDSEETKNKQEPFIEPYSIY